MPCCALRVALFLAVLAFPAGAQEWEQFGFRKLGFGFDVPSAFVWMETARNGRSASFEADDGAFLMVWGDTLPKRDFAATVQGQLDADHEEGWNIMYRRLAPTWASYSGVKEGRIRYFRAIAVCNDRIGVFQLDYDIEDKVPYDPIVVRMVDSLKEDRC